MLLMDFIICVESFKGVYSDHFLTPPPHLGMATECDSILCQNQKVWIVS